MDAAESLQSVEDAQWLANLAAESMETKGHPLCFDVGMLMV